MDGPPHESTWPSTGPGGAPEPRPSERLEKRPAPAPGSTERLFGEHYELHEELGRGAMGVVHRAVDRRTGREVAIKLVKDPDDHPERLERFRREALVMAALVHPGILHVLDAGARPRPFMVTELIPGARTYAAVHADLPRRARVELLRDSARALGFAHARGIVHRDVKPSNLLVDAAGRIKVADFGLAGIAGFQPLTRTGSLVGTPLYMSPEQIQGRTHDVGPATDVWGLGVVLYGSLCEALPFEGSDFVSLSRAICAARPRPPRAVDPTIHPALEAVCLRALRADPADRFSDGEAFARALEQALDPTTAPARALVWLPLAACAAFAALVLVVLVVEGLRGASDAPPPRDPSSTIASTASAVAPRPPPVDPTTASTSTAGVDTMAALRAAAERGEREAQGRLGAALVDDDPIQAALWLERAAHAGHAAAMYDLAHLSEVGRGADLASGEAFGWYRRAADANEPRALSRLADAFRHGRADVGIARDDARAVELYRRAAATGHAPAMNNLGTCYATGTGVPRDMTEARAWLQRAAEGGHALGMKNLGQLLIVGEGGAKDPSAGIDWMRRSAAAGCVDAMLFLGRAHLDGKEVTRDPRAGAEWMKLAAETGDVEGMNGFGVCLARGIGVPRDARAAAGWYRRAAEGGYTRAMTNYAESIQAGHAEETDETAHAWLERAARAGDENGMVNLGAHLIGKHKDYAGAAVWYEKAAEAGVPEAMTNLAGLRLLGLGVPKSPEAAAAWYAKAAEKGSTEGMYELALLLESGQGVAPDEAAALALLRRAADADHVKAMVHLAKRLRARGDAVAARAWLEKAAATGDARAREALQAWPAGAE